MVRQSAQPRLLLALLSAVLALGAACGSRTKTVGPVITPKVPAATVHVPQPSPAPEPPPDPAETLIALSDRHFRAGQKELELGHVGAAKLEFDQAITVLMESSYGGRTEPRIREHFDRLVDRISAYEIKALAAGDGFTEKRYEPASIDELLALSETFIQPPATPELAETVAEDLETVGYDVPIPFNQKVLSYIELFQGRLHDFIQEGLTRGSKYLPMIQSVFRAEGLPLDLAYIPLIESAFKTNALSRAKAKGVWQFMRGTGIEMGLRHDWYIDERSDPEKATIAAAKYLAALSKMFEGDWHLALASYNGGPGRVQRAMKRGKLSDFWRLSAAKANLLPRETREYVPMILAAVVIARNPAQYGFAFEPEPLPSYQLVTLPGPVDLRRIAEWIDTPIDEIQALNPELRRWTTPVKDKSYALKVPVGAADIVSARLEEAATTDLASLKWYTVRKGETLATIARNLRVSRTDLAEANYLKAASRVATGQKLMVPHEATVLMTARADRPVPVAESRVITTEAVVPVMASPNSERVKIMYKVKRGDTLASIARTFKTTVASLQTWNRIPGSVIRAGERLTVYTRRTNDTL